MEIIRRFVKALSYEGAIVLDFFAGSGTTGRVCIEENRNSILIDTDSTMKEYFKKHILKADVSSSKPYEIFEDIQLDKYFKLVKSATQTE